MKTSSFWDMPLSAWSNCSGRSETSWYVCRTISLHNNILRTIEIQLGSAERFIAPLSTVLCLKIVGTLKWAGYCIGEVVGQECTNILKGTSSWSSIKVGEKMNTSGRWQKNVFGTVMSAEYLIAVGRAGKSEVAQLYDRLLGLGHKERHAKWPSSAFFFFIYKFLLLSSSLCS